MSTAKKNEVKNLGFALKRVILGVMANPNCSRCGSETFRIQPTKATIHGYPPESKATTFWHWVEMISCDNCGAIAGVFNTEVEQKIDKIKSKVNA